MTTTTRGFTQPLAVVVGLLLCVGVGYAIMRGFSYSQQSGMQVAIRSGAPLDAPLIDPAAHTHTQQGTFNTELQRPEMPAKIVEYEEVKPEEIESGFMALSFAKLSNFRYVYPDPDQPPPEEDQIPASVRQLDGKQVAIRGFMLPVKAGEDGRVTEFLLMRDQSACCFGIMPQMNEWLHVLFEDGESAPMIYDIPTTVYGTLEVGEAYEDDILMSIYRLRFDKLIEP